MQFNEFNVVYDEEGYDYPVDDEGKFYVPMDPQATFKIKYIENRKKPTKRFWMLVL